MIRPCINKVKLDRIARRGISSSPIEPNAGAGILRSHTERDSVGHSVSRHPADRIRDVRFPVTHPNIDRQFDSILKQRRLPKRPFCQWAFADLRISMLNFFNNALWNGSSADNVFQVFRNLLNRLRRPMRQQQHGIFALLQRFGTRCPRSRLLRSHLGADFTHPANNLLHIFYRRTGNNAMADVEDMPGNSAGLPQNFLHALAQDRLRREETR